MLHFGSASPRRIALTSFGLLRARNITLSIKNAVDFNLSADMIVIPMFSCSKVNKKKTNGSCVALEKQFMQHYELLGKSEEFKNKALDMFKNGVFDGSSSSSCIASYKTGKYVTFLGMGEPISEMESDAYVCPTSDAETTGDSHMVHFPRPFSVVDGGRRNTMHALGKELANLAVKYDQSVVDGNGSFESVQVLLPPSLCSPALLRQLRMGFDDGAYLDTRFKLNPARRNHRELALQRVSVVRDSLLDPQDIMLSVEQRINRDCDAVQDGVLFARDLVNSPSNVKTPPAIAQMACDFAQELGLECKVLGKAECEELGMGAYLGVQQGSRFDPAFLHLTYKPTRTDNAVPTKRKCVVLVGKGLTFDSGGYNLKVGASQIELMKMDMGGCAAVLGTARVIAQLRPDVEVHFISALCENMVSAEAMRPGDVLIASNKKTIEVLNTDAEGRLTLADALVYASNIRSMDGRAPDAIVDLATLTGACVVALGENMSALYTNDLSLGNKLLTASEVRELQLLLLNTIEFCSLIGVFLFFHCLCSSFLELWCYPLSLYCTCRRLMISFG